MFYPSTTSIYGKTDQATIKSECNVCKSNYYAKMKLSCEDLIKKKIKNYTIFRLPIVLCNPVTENFVFTYPRKENIEVISDRDAAYMFVRAIENVDKLNRKTYNVGGGKYSRISSDELDNRMLKTYGINKYSYNNDVNSFARHISIDGEVYYIMYIGDIKIGDKVEVEYLPNSKIILSINKK